VRPKSLTEQTFTIGELSRRTGVTIETTRYYERIGLMPRPARTRGGHRTFGAEELRTLSFIKRSRELGFSLEDIRTLLSLRGARRCCMHVKAVAARHLEDVRAKMRDLTALEGILAGTVDRCPGDDSPDCPMLDLLEIDRKDAQPPLASGPEGRR
jgi:MerR family transcriptional regulator, mercuric resistance operon regulatory protein